MTLCLPRPYPDELVYSVLARYFAYIQPTGVIGAHMTIDGRRRFSIKFVRGAARLAEQTRLTWGLSGQQLVSRHTLLPFYGAFLDPDAYLRCTEDFLSDNSHTAVATLGINNSSVTEPTYLRFCALCAQEDLDVHGETFWRRQHQICGTLFCTRHWVLLQNSAAAVSPPHSRLSDASQYCRVGAQASSLVDSGDNRLARLIAERSASILNGTLSSWLHADTGFQYQRAAAEVGYGVGSTKINTKSLARDLLSYFGASLLSKIGCSLSINSAPLRHIFHGCGTNHPLIHVLVQLFLEAKLEASRARLKSQALDGSSRQDWKCPNIFARHSADFRVPEVILRRGDKGGQYFYARCSCGFAFSFSTSQEDDPNMPVVARASRYGKAIEREVRRMYAASGSIQAVCREMHLNYRAVKRSLHGSKNAFEPSVDKVQSLRKKWLETRSRSSYQALLRNDREWILGRRKRLNRRPSNRSPCRQVRPSNRLRHADVA